MRTFITWSGDLSRGVALELREFLRLLFPTIEPFVSARDIRNGSEWRSALTTALAASQRGIICLTADNFTEPWVLFEAGALSRSLARPVLYTVLIGDLDPAELEGSPLSAFQHSRLQHHDIKALFKSINDEIAYPRTDEEFDKAFEAFWLDFDSRVTQLLKMNEGSRRLIRIADVARDSTIIAGRVFRNAIIRGPAVLAILEGISLKNCIFAAPDQDAMLWRPLSNMSVGAIGLTRCDFENCIFEGIGLTGADETIEEFKKFNFRQT